MVDIFQLIQDQYPGSTPVAKKKNYQGLVNDGMFIFESFSKIKDTGGINKAAVAVANKNTRIVMAMLLSGENYQNAA